jgi:hypothetical protein
MRGLLFKETFMINVTCFTSATQTKPWHAEASWSELVEFLASYTSIVQQRSSKKRHNAMTLAHVEGGRGNAKVMSVSGIAADVDIGPDNAEYRTFDQMHQWLRQQGWAFVIYSTTKSRVSHNRFRVVLIFEHSISPDKHRAAWEAVNHKLGGVIDKGTKDPARLSFLPADWQGDYIDDRTRVVTPIDDGFNAFAWVDGNPILAADELLNLPSHIDSPSTAKISGKRARINADHTAPSPLPRPANMVPEYLEVLSDWERSPYIRDWMRKIAEEPGQRDFRFLCAVARHALRIGLWIDVELLVAIGSTFSQEALNRYPPDDLIRQAENALEFAKAEPR